MRIGIDIGGVIISQDTDSPDLFFSENYLTAKAAEDAFATIQSFVETYGKENIYLVSKCGTEVQKKTLNWLKEKDFYTITGFDPGNIRFCLERHLKRNHCEELGIEVFIDDRYSVLCHLQDLTNIKQLYLFNPNPREMKLYEEGKKDLIKITSSWKEINCLDNIREAR